MNFVINMAFLDSGFFIAWTVKKDAYHNSSQEALVSFKTNKARLYTSNYVLQETITRIIYRAGFTVAKLFIDQFSQLEDADLITVIWIDHFLHQKTIEILQKYRDHPFSFVDASIIAIVKHLKLQQIYTTDSLLRQTGLNVVVLNKEK